MKLKIERLPKNDMLVEGCWHGCWISNSPMVKTQDRSVTGSSRRCIHIGSWQRSYQRSRKTNGIKIVGPKPWHYPLTTDRTDHPVLRSLQQLCQFWPWIHTLYGKEPIYLSSQPNELCDFLVLLHKSFKIKGGHVHHICKCYHSQLQLPFNSHATSHPRIVEVCALASDVKQSERSPKPEDSQRFQTISFCISKFPKVSWVRLYHPISRSLWLIFGGEYVTFTKADP